MDYLFSRLRQYSIGTIVFGSFTLIALLFTILGKCNVFYSEYDPNYDLPSDIVVTPDVPGIHTNYLSYVIFVISIALFSLFVVFWLIFAILDLSLSIKLDKKINAHLTRLAIINFFTFFVGAVLSLGTCNALLDDRKNNEYIRRVKDF